MDEGLPEHAGRARRKPDWRAAVYGSLSGAPTGRLGRIASLALIVLILLNVAAVILESVPALGARYAAWFNGFETFSVIVFAVEYALRLWACTHDARYRDPLSGRLRFAIRPLSLIDLAAIVPSMLEWSGLDLRFLRIVRVFRLVRLAKLARYTHAMRFLGHIFSDKREELVLAVSFMLVVLVISASLMYFAEHATQPEAFSSIPAAMWWAAMTLTTVGYGDVYPVTGLGKTMASVIAMAGVGLFALPAGIVSATLIEMRMARRLTHCPHCGKPLTGADVQAGEAPGQHR